MYTIIIVKTVQGFITELRDRDINSGCYVGTLGSFEKAVISAQNKADLIGEKVEDEIDYSQTS